MEILAASTRAGKGETMGGSQGAETDRQRQTAHIPPLPPLLPPQQRARVCFGGNFPASVTQGLGGEEK